MLIRNIAKTQQGNKAKIISRSGEVKQRKRGTYCSLMFSRARGGTEQNKIGNETTGSFPLLWPILIPTKGSALQY